MKRNTVIAATICVLAAPVFAQNTNPADQDVQKNNPSNAEKVKKQRAQEAREREIKVEKERTHEAREREIVKAAREREIKAEKQRAPAEREREIKAEKERENANKK